MKFFVIMIGVLAGLSSCINNTKNGNEKRFDSSAIFYDYQVWGEEGDSVVTLLLQYRMGNEEGSSMALDSAGKVLLDGTEILPDSARLTGAYYEVSKRAKEFRGAHTILFTDKKGKEHKQEFSFLPFSLAAELPAQINKEPFTMRLNGFTKAPTLVRLVMIDTAFTTKDVNEELMIENGELTITAKMWRALKTGPITMEIYREEETLPKNGSTEAGRLTMTYGLKREFEAVEN